MWRLTAVLLLLASALRLIVFDWRWAPVLGCLGISALVVFACRQLPRHYADGKRRVVRGMGGADGENRQHEVAEPPATNAVINHADGEHLGNAKCQHRQIDNNSGRCLRCGEEMVAMCPERKLDYSRGLDTPVVVILPVYECTRCHHGQECGQMHCGEVLPIDG